MNHNDNTIFKNSQSTRNLNRLNYSVGTPYDLSLLNEKKQMMDEKRRYKEDLDYLISLRRKLGEEEFNLRYGNYFNDIKRRYESMQELFNYNQSDDRNFKKHLMKEYENDIYTTKDKERIQKQLNLDEEKKYIEVLNYQNYLENQKKIENKLKLKSEKLRELDNFYQRKHNDDLRKQEEIIENIRYIDENKRQIDERENQFRSKINRMNERIYDNVIKHNGYNHNSNSEQTIYTEPYYLKNDVEFNKRVGEMKARERDFIKKDPTLVNERLKDLDRLREFENKQKLDKMENQRLYKNYLDYQSVNKSTIDSNKEDPLNPLIMPGYHHPNLPIPTSKKAIDSITWVKSNHTETLHNGNRQVNYLGETKLRHNPIIQPLNDHDYNKYLNKQRYIYNLNDQVIRTEAGNSSKTLANVGNSIIS